MLLTSSVIRNAARAGLQHRRRSSKCHPNRRQSSIAATGTIEQLRHVLPDRDMSLEVLHSAPTTSTTSSKPPLVFIHGSYHAAWCWAEHFLPYFSALGYDCYAPSLRGHGMSSMPPNSSAGSLDQHGADVAHFLESLGRPAVLIGHSFGGLIAQEVHSRRGATRLAGLALLASVPPMGNGPMVKRFLVSKPLASLKITWGFVTKAFERDADLCRDAFFSPDLALAEVLRYQALIRGSSRARLLDLSALAKSLPLPPPPAGAARALVMGGADDYVVDEEGLRESAAALGTLPVVLPRTAHDLMLDVRWEAAANELAAWLKEDQTFA